MFRIKQQSMRWFRESLDSSGFDARENVITTEFHLFADQCKLAADRGYLNLGYSSVGNIPLTLTNAEKTNVEKT